MSHPCPPARHAASGVRSPARAGGRTTRPGGHHATGRRTAGAALLCGVSAFLCAPAAAQEAAQLFSRALAHEGAAGLTAGASVESCLVRLTYEEPLGQGRVATEVTVEAGLLQTGLVETGPAGDTAIGEIPLSEGSATVIARATGLAPEQVAMFERENGATCDATSCETRASLPGLVLISIGDDAVARLDTAVEALGEIAESCRT
ncbi:hypothetical protein [Wenxinia saemankumensis]|uniref:Uncharacterized protein n=1 Tax=Wenxinia saemankumensis TaxID=1447782 RepID=A0A1M6GNN4_9RHOB|nr:hypothetical protein [Wenxinia saemankumensis]SHJ11528.1 hypothetical protein SAMN05444417_2829 [Wenxinia saemankumensis]